MTCRSALASLLHRIAEALDRSEPSAPAPGSPAQAALDSSRDRHPSRGGAVVVPIGYARGRADLQLTHGDRKAQAEEFWAAIDSGRLRRGHGASEGDPDL